jgi:cell division protein FtsQ
VKYNKITKHAREKKKETGKSRLLKFVTIALFFAFIIFLSIYFISSYLASEEVALSKKINSYISKAGFTIEELYIEGADRKTPSDIISSAGVKRGDSIFKKSPWEIRSNIEKLQWIRNVVVDRQLPDKLYIGVTERKPIAIKQFNKKLQLIDETGQVFFTEDVSSFSALPIFVGEDVEDHILFVMSYLKKDQAIYNNIYSVQRIGNRRWDVVLQDKTIIKLPEAGEERAWEKFIKMYNEDKSGFSAVKIVDLRVDKKIFIEKRVN